MGSHPHASWPMYFFVGRMGPWCGGDVVGRALMEELEPGASNLLAADFASRAPYSWLLLVWSAKASLRMAANLALTLHLLEHDSNKLLDGGDAISILHFGLCHLPVHQIKLVGCQGDNVPFPCGSKQLTTLLSNFATLCFSNECP